MSQSDPFNLHRRLQTFAHLWAQRLEENLDVVPNKELKEIIATVGAHLMRDVKLSTTNESEQYGGQAIRKYAGAFKSNVARAGKDVPGRGKGRSGQAYTLDSDSESAESDSD